MTSIMSQAWKIVKPHIPMIRFRKGTSPANTVNATPAAAAASPSVGAKSQKPAGTVLEDYQLPPRYRRQGLDEKEIDAINSGGAY